MHIIFQDTQYVDVVAGEVLCHKDIEIKDGKIAAISGAYTLDGAEIIDGRDLCSCRALSTPTPIWA